MEGTPNVGDKVEPSLERTPMRRRSLASLATAFVLSSTAAVAGSNKAPEQPVPESTPTQIQLADELTDMGMKYYGSYRCHACHYQGRLFGRSAVKRLPYVECTKPESLPEQAQACRTAKIRAFPTWIHPSGERREGVQSLTELRLWIEQP